MQIYLRQAPGVDGFFFNRRCGATREKIAPCPPEGKVIPPSWHVNPRIEKRDAQAREIPHVARHHDESVLKSGSGDQAIRRVERSPFQLAFTPQNAPAVADTLGHREYSVAKQRKEVLFKPLFQLRSAFALGHGRESPAEFSNADNAQVQGSVVLSGNPIAYPRIRREFR